VTPNPTFPEWRAPREQAPLDGTPFLEWTLPGGAIWTRFYRTDHGYLLRFPGLADFEVSLDGKAVAVHPVTGVSEPTVDHLYLNQVLPLALSRQFKLVLHASAIEVDDHAVAFLGLSGRGKSTLAASFSTHSYRFLTDDGLQLEKSGDVYLAQPSHPSIRLWDDSRQAVVPDSAKDAPPVDYTPKARVLADKEVAFCDMARPLPCVYFLGEGKSDTVTIAPIGGRDAMIELVRHTFLLDIEERDMLMHHFGQLTELVKALKFFRLDYPRRYDYLETVREAIVQHVHSECESRRQPD